MDESASSSTWSRTSTSSSTSDPRTTAGPRPSPSARLAGFIRLIHPFPSLLDGIATAGIAVIAAGRIDDALRLGFAMVAMQASIGALNDLLDVSVDRGRKPGKPIPAGLVSPGAARAVVFAGAALGLGLALPSGPLTFAVGVAILAVGYAYDARFKGTAWSWLPFALGIPLLPVFAWLGATGTLPPAFAVLVPCAGLAGAALAIANALADVERDRRAGASSVAVDLGPVAAWRIHAGLHGMVVLAALATLPLFGAGGLGVLGAILGAGLVLAGVTLARRRGAGLRERAWELEAVGVALLGAGWVVAVHGPR